MTIATRALHVLAVHFVRGQTEHLGNGQTSLKHRLRVQLDDHVPVMREGGHGTRGANGGMHVKGPLVSGFQYLRDDLCTGTGLRLDRLDSVRGCFEQPVKNSIVRWQLGVRLPFGAFL